MVCLKMITVVYLPRLSYGMLWLIKWEGDDRPLELTDLHVPWDQLGRTALKWVKPPVV